LLALFLLLALCSGLLFWMHNAGKKQDAAAESGDVERKTAKVRKRPPPR
jgi:hypothetical protein